MKDHRSSASRSAARQALSAARQKQVRFDSAMIASGRLPRLGGFAEHLGVVRVIGPGGVVKWQREVRADV